MGFGGPDGSRLRLAAPETCLSRALSHLDILFLLDVGETNGIHYAVAELLEGENSRVLVAQGPVPVKRALEIAHLVADAPLPGGLPFRKA